MCPQAKLSFTEFKYWYYIKPRDTLCRKLAWALPRRLAYWAFIRVASHATMGPYSDSEAGKVSILEALHRWHLD